MSDPQAIAHDEFFDSLLGDFLDESGQLLDRLNENLLRLDAWVRSLDDPALATCDADLLNEMFRAAHSLKGLSAMLGLADINTLTHKVENVFDAARRAELPVTGDVVEVVFHAVDRLGGLVESLRNPAMPRVECESVVESIGRMLQSAGVERHQTTQADAEAALAAEFANATPPAADASAAAGAADASVSADLSTVEHSTQKRSTAECSALEAAASAPADDAIDLFSGLEDETETPSKYLSIFIDETELSLDSLTETLLSLEGDGEQETIEQLMIIAHRIKGSAASVGLGRPAKLAHLMEDGLQELLERHDSLSPRLTDAMLLCTDGLRHYVQGLKTGERPSSEFNALAHALLAAQMETPPPAAPTVKNDTPSLAPLEHATLGDHEVADAAAAAAVDTRAATPASQSPHDWVPPAELAALVGRRDGIDAVVIGRAIFQPGLALVGLKAQLLYEKLANLGEIGFFDPPLETLDELETLAAVHFGLLTDRMVDEVRRKLRIAGISQIDVVLVEQREATLDGASPALACPAAGASAHAGPSAASAAPAPTTAANRAAANTAAVNAAIGAPSAAASAAAGEAAGKTSSARASDASGRPAETLRVDIERLDQLMNLAGQLVINKARFARIGDQLQGALTARHGSSSLRGATESLRRMCDDSDGDAHNAEQELANLRALARRLQRDLEAVRHDMEMLNAMRGSVNDLFESIHQLDRVTDAIQQSVMDTRMLPIGPLFARFRRVVRDITRGNGKNINLVINGEKTELDKRMIDELSDPLIHMVRNAADHGIESPEARIAAGKPPEGTLTLDAFHRGNSIYIQVTDDGKGLDAERIRRKAVEKGLLSAAEAEKLARQQVFQLIWEPGLSTAEKVTEVSGRGMGMDIVKSKIDDLNGVIELESEPGQGTRLTIKLPLTLAILPSLMVEIEGDVFALPLEAVVEIVRVGRDEMSTVHQQRVTHVRGRFISTIRLRDMFVWNSGGVQAADEESGETTMVVIEENGREIGLIVDRVIGEEDVVIKSIAENYRNIAGVAGASILGDGRVSLILDLSALVAMAARQTAANE